METFQVNDVSVQLIIFLAIFSAAFGLFYYLVLKGIYERKLTLVWPLFVLPPFFVILTAIIDPGYVPLVCGIHAPILVLLMLGGPIYNAFIKKEGSAWQLLFFYFAIPLAMFTWPWGFGIMVIAAVVMIIIKPSKKSEFYGLQRTLPTSKIRSMAMGMVEVIGKTTMLEPVISKLGDEPCIGYLYKVDKIKVDKEGDKSYSNISKETVCNPFLLHDGTEVVTVSGTDISLIDLPLSPHSFEGGGRRYQLYLLLENTEILLIGKATNQKQLIRIQKDDEKQVFGVAPIDQVQKWNLYRPLRISAIRHFVLLAVLVMGVLICDFEVVDNEIIVTVSSLYDSAALFENSLSFYKNIFQ